LKNSPLQGIFNWRTLVADLIKTLSNQRTIQILVGVPKFYLG